MDEGTEKKGQYNVIGSWLPENAGWSIAKSVAVGICFLIISCLLWLGVCWWPYGFLYDKYVCSNIWASPPWGILSGLATAPSILLLWYWRTIHRNKEIAAAQEQVKIGQEQTRIAQESQVTDRFIAAVKLLSERDKEGEDRTTARLGGIYALQRIAIDSPRDKDMTQNTLSSFVRDNVERLPNEKDKQKSNYNLKTDVEAALRVLQDQGLGGAIFPLANFASANLSSAYLGHALLGGSDLRSAYLVDVFARGANFAGVNFSNANLTGAYFVDAYVAGAKFTDATLENVNFERANLKHANLRYANLKGAYFGDAKYDLNTAFPEGFDPEANGMVKTED